MKERAKAPPARSPKARRRSLFKKRQGKAFFHGPELEARSREIRRQPRPEEEQQSAEPGIDTSRLSLKPRSSNSATAAGGPPGAVPGSTAREVQGLSGSGRPLTEPSRAFFERSFGVGLDQVRVHADERAGRLASSLGARAFTHGSDVVFGEGEYRPGSTEGKRLLAHELTHVLQQSGPRRAVRSGTVQRKDDVTETNISKTTDTGNKYTQELVLNKTQKTIRIDLGVEWVKKGTWASDAAMQKFISKVEWAAYTYMDNKFKVVCTPVAKGAGKGKIELPITFLLYGWPTGYKIDVIGGTPGGDSEMAQAGGKVYEYQTNGTKEEAITFAHEFGHALLGASDEYANPAVPGRVLTNDHSIMANYYTQGKSQAEFKARHFKHIATEVAKAFAGYRCAIKKI